jgi:hypothetical protein
VSFLRVLRQGGAALAKADAVEPPQAVNFDPYINTYAQNEYRTKIHPGTLAQTYEQLEWWSRQPVIQLPPIIQRRAVCDFCKASDTDWKPGFQVKLKEEKKEMSKAAQKVAREITKVLLRAGGQWQWPPAGGVGGNMEAAMGMLVSQSLIYDQAVFEPLYTKGNKPWGWLTQDATTFRLAQPSTEEKARGQVYPAKDRTYTQLSDTGAVVRVFGEDEIAWLIRNPRVGMRWRGYGFPEYDELSYSINSLYQTFVYNDANFRNGIHAHTIMLFRTAMDSTQFDNVRRGMITMLSQPRNAHRAMMLQLRPQTPGQTEAGREDLDIKQVGQNNSEMEFSKWLDFLIKILCAGYGMDPIEMNLLYGNEGQSSSMQSANPEARASMSRGRWLPSLLRKLEYAFNNAIVDRFDPDFAMRFTGLGAPSASERLELDIKAERSFMTPNEVRARYDLPPLDFEVADKVPLDPALINAFMQTAAQGDAEQGDPDGFEGFEPAPGTDKAPLDDVMKGTDWNNVDEWTTKFATAIAPRMRRIDRGAGCVTWQATL